MAEWWRNKGNSWFGSNVTYVANAYPSAKYVWLLFHNKTLTLTNVSLSGSAREFDIKIDTKVENEKVTEKVRIPYKDFHKKQRKTSDEYITILAKDKDGEDVKICENYCIGANRSFIITKEGGLKPQKYGGDIWTDESGVNHKPK